eukprot:Lithocolla_globosa_v1_NODE_2243_length_2092_cov_5.676485.p2 type:complete len:108 gc:universal NODE_2243_length_2092_cov_5.676485:1064-1387(+)
MDFKTCAKYDNSKLSRERKKWKWIYVGACVEYSFPHRMLCTALINAATSIAQNNKVLTSSQKQQPRFTTKKLVGQDPSTNVDVIFWSQSIIMKKPRDSIFNFIYLDF